MITDFIDPGDPRWDRALERLPHDVYHLPEYVALAARHEGGTPVAFYAETSESAFLIPLLIRRLPSWLGAPTDWCDVATPYGYSTPIATDQRDDRAVDEFLAAFRAAGQSYGIVTAFIRLHPFLVMSREVLMRHGLVDTHGQTVYVDLSLGLDQLWAQTRPNHRRDINKLLRAGFAAKMDDWSLYDEFRSVYRATMERLSAAEFYFFSDTYFEELRSTLRNRFSLCSVLSPRGEVAAAGLFAVTNGIVQYHLGGTAEAFREQAPSKLMFDFVRRWAKQHGKMVLHLGGGVGANADALFHFKAGYSRSLADFSTYQMVLDEGRYALLNLRSQERFADAGSAKPEFFPVYRRPRVR